jgi:hypothetical protein
MYSWHDFAGVIGLLLIFGALFLMLMPKVTGWLTDKIMKMTWKEKSK